MENKLTTFNFFTYGLSGFSLSQILGVLFAGFSFYQSALILLGFCFLVSIPGFIRYGMMQRINSSRLGNYHIFSCFVPSLIAVGILIAGFVIGVIAV
ncbi:MAG: hypothetical protein ACYTXA_16275 [Nostoc sp.]